jgi:hypothetical protein
LSSGRGPIRFITYPAPRASVRLLANSPARLTDALQAAEGKYING